MPNGLGAGTQCPHTARAPGCSCLTHSRCEKQRLGAGLSRVAGVKVLGVAHMGQLFCLRQIHAWLSVWLLPLMGHKSPGGEGGARGKILGMPRDHGLVTCVLCLFPAL